MSDHSDGALRLDRPVDGARDHVLGSAGAAITLVEYGSYACPHCRLANERIVEVRDRLGDKLRYVFRHLPLAGNELARRAAELAEMAPSDDAFWDAHVALMTRSEVLTEDDLRAVEQQLGLPALAPEASKAAAETARARVVADETSARASGVRYTPSFFINGKHYDGPWDTSSFKDVLLGSLGHRMRSAALSFASWAPSTGVLLVLASVLAVLVMNSPWQQEFAALWRTPIGFNLGDAGFSMSLQHWVDDGLLTIFFLVVGLEIKREFTVGSLAKLKSAALPVAAAIGGMVVPALVYLLVIPAGPLAGGWGVPMATDTAFAIALIAMLGRRVPVELRILLTAAAIVDDIGAITVVAIFYSGDLRLDYLAGAAAIVGLLAVLNRSSVYRLSPYLIVGLALWACIHAGGLHATLTGVLLAIFIPTRPPPNYRALAIQAQTILDAEAQGGDQLRHGPSEPALRALDAIHDRIESPADRLLRTVAPRSSLLVLPIFALANAGVVLSLGALEGNGMLMLAIIAGLVVGKPVGFLVVSALAVKLGLARKSEAYSWTQLVGAGALAGIGFTMSLLIAGQAFAEPVQFDAAKTAVFAASVLSAAIGVLILWKARTPSRQEIG